MASHRWTIRDLLEKTATHYHQMSKVDYISVKVIDSWIAHLKKANADYRTLMILKRTRGLASESAARHYVNDEIKRLESERLLMLMRTGA